ncbi:MAG TPA: DUF2304 domain-containing protein [Propionibacterium sp.]|nr:DUF2304 domain-containing protein [Propionibacterium sp.]
MNVTITFLVVGALFVLVLFWVLRSGRIREKYVALWGLIGVAGVVLAIWPDLLSGLTRLLGFQLPANLLFFLAILLLLGVCLHLSVEASKLEDETRTLAEEVALLHLRIDRLQGQRADESTPPRT